MEPRDHRDRDEATRDAALLSRVAAGDRDAFRSMYERYFDRLFRFVHRVVDRYDQVEEIVNDTMYVVWSKADTFAGRSRVSTWLFGIAYRKSLKALEKQRRIKEDLMQEEHLERLGPTATPDAIREREEWLQAGLCRLSPEHRAVVELTYYFGYSYREIATIVECPENTVKTRMYHARKRLRSLLPTLSSDSGKRTDDG